MVNGIGGPSENFRQLVTQAKQDNHIDRQEAESIKQALLDEISSSGFTESQVVDYVIKANDFLNTELEGTNAVYELDLDDGSEDVSKETTVTLNMSIQETTGEEVTVSPEIRVTVSDTEDRSTDTRFTELREDPTRFLEYSEDGSISGVHRSEMQIPEGTKMQDIILEDFNKFAEPPLSEVFQYQANGDNSESIEKLRSALTKVDGVNPENLTDENLLELLSYMNTGAGTDGKVNVKNLQNLLEKTTGDIGTEIRGKNTEAGGDNKYGYATTLQVRSLGAMVPDFVPQEPRTETITETEKVKVKDLFGTEILPKDPSRVMVAFDVSGSMSGNVKETINNFDDVIAQHPEHHIGVMKFDGNSDGRDRGTILQPAVQSDLTQQDIKTMGRQNVEKSKGYHQESGFNAAIQAIEHGFPETGDPAIDSLPKEVIVYTDEPDKSPGNLEKLIKLAEKHNVKVTFVNPDNGAVVTLGQIENAVEKHGKGKFMGETKARILDLNGNKRGGGITVSMDHFDIFKVAKYQ